MNEKDPHRYDDIIDLPHFVSDKYPQMSNLDRAAQFAPFDALTGYDEAMEETARTTDDEITLGEHEMMILDQRFHLLAERISEKPEVTVTYFVPDLYKEGGYYKTETVRIRKLDLVSRILITTDKQKIDLDYIITIDSAMLAQYTE